MYVNLLSPFLMNCVLLWGFCVNVFLNERVVIVILFFLWDGGGDCFNSLTQLLYTFYVLSLYLEASNSPIQFMNICDKYLSINSFICKLDIFQTNPSFYICWALFRFDYYRYSYNKYMYSLLIRFIRDGSIWYNNKRCTYLIRVSAVYMVAVWVHYIRDLLFWPAVVFLVLNTGNDFLVGLSPTDSCW